MPRLSVATVDHGLREGSRGEAEWVARTCARLGILHRILTWDGPRPSRGVQAAARVARYRLLSMHAREVGADLIVTAHTRDDQAETLVMRLARGSGVDGLGAMRRLQPISAMLGSERDDGALPSPPRILIARPLLGVPRDRLVATLTALGETWLDDPSNRDLRFERVRLRAARDKLAAVGLDDAALARSAARLARASAALDQATSRLVERLITVDPGVLASFALATFAQEPEELRVRVLARLLGGLGGSGQPAPLERAERLAAWLTSMCHHGSAREGETDAEGSAARHAGQAGRAACTLAGCRVVSHAGQVTIWREWGREGLPEVLLSPGRGIVWDGRFRIGLAAEAPGPVVVGPLGSPDARELARHALAPLGTGVSRGRLPHAVARTLPAVRRDGSLLAVHPWVASAEVEIAPFALPAGHGD